MGKIDTEAKKYLSNATRFCDIFNFLIYDGETEQDFEKFHTKLGAALQFIKHQNDDNMDWLENKEQEITVDRDTADFIQTTAGTDLHLNDDEEVINVCKAWKNSMD